MKIGLVEKILIALSVTVVLGSFAFALNARSEPDSVVVLKTLGMTCGSCAGKIEKALMGKPGVAKVAVNVEAAQVVVFYDSQVANPGVLTETVTAAGFRNGVAQNLSMAEYQKLADRNVFVKTQARSVGCGGSCCN